MTLDYCNVYSRVSNVTPPTITKTGAVFELQIDISFEWRAHGLMSVSTKFKWSKWKHGATNGFVSCGTEHWACRRRGPAPCNKKNTPRVPRPGKAPDHMCRPIWGFLASIARPAVELGTSSGPHRALLLPSSSYSITLFTTRLKLNRWMLHHSKRCAWLFGFVLIVDFSGVFEEEKKPLSVIGFDTLEHLLFSYCPVIQTVSTLL